MSKKAVIYVRMMPIERQYDTANDDPNDEKLKLLRNYAAQEVFRSRADVERGFNKLLIVLVGVGVAVISLLFRGLGG